MNGKQKQLGFIGIITENREKSSNLDNKIPGKNADIIPARTGLPRANADASVIKLVFDATTDEPGVLKGNLGNIEGVSVKSGLSKN